MLFAAFACRQLMNLGRGNTTSDSLARFPIQARGRATELTGHRSWGGVRIVDCAGPPGRRWFEARLRMDETRYEFTLNAKGFGLLGGGLGCYAPTSVTVLIQRLAERRRDDDEFTSALGRAAPECGSAFLNGELTLLSQNTVALKLLQVPGCKLGVPVKFEGPQVLQNPVSRTLRPWFIDGGAVPTAEPGRRISRSPVPSLRFGNSSTDRPRMPSTTPAR